MSAVDYSKDIEVFSLKGEIWDADHVRDRGDGSHLIKFDGRRAIVRDDIVQSYIKSEDEPGGMPADPELMVRNKKGHEGGNG